MRGMSPKRKNNKNKKKSPSLHFVTMLALFPVIMSPSEIVLVDCPFFSFFYSLPLHFCAHLDREGRNAESRVDTEPYSPPRLKQIWIRRIAWQEEDEVSLTSTTKVVMLKFNSGQTCLMSEYRGVPRKCLYYIVGYRVLHFLLYYFIY